MSFRSSRALLLVLLCACAGTRPDAQAEDAAKGAETESSSEPQASPAGLAQARARVQALVNAPANRLSAFRPRLALATDPREGVKRNVPVLSATSPWSSPSNTPSNTEQLLWIQVPEHAWTMPREGPGRRLLFPGDDPSWLKAQWRTPVFAAREPAAWVPQVDGSFALDCALEQDVRVHFRVLPGERMLELRFGVSNGSQQALRETWAQMCTILGGLGALGEQAPETSWMVMQGALVHWGAAGQDLAWLAGLRDAATGRLGRAAFFLALVQGCQDERYPPRRFQEGDTLWLERAADLALLGKSSPDLTRHVVFYSPQGRALMYNAFRPCAHVDPRIDGVAPGETRWGVVYLLFFEGEREALVEGLVALDAELRSAQGFFGAE